MTHEADICCARPRDASTHGSSALIHACPDPRTSPSARRLGPRAVCAVHGCYSHISCTMHACDAVARYRDHGASDASPCGSFALTYAIIIAPPATCAPRPQAAYPPYMAQGKFMHCMAMRLNGGTPGRRSRRGGCGSTSGGGEDVERVVSAVEAHAVHFLPVHGREKKQGSCCLSREPTSEIFHSKIRWASGGTERKK